MSPLSEGQAPCDLTYLVRLETQKTRSYYRREEGSEELVLGGVVSAWGDDEKVLELGGSESYTKRCVQSVLLNYNTRWLKR